MIGSDFFLRGCKSNNLTADINELFQSDRIEFLDQVGDTILPQTSTPGAKAAKVGNFMAIMVRDCYTPEDQKIFMDGISKLNEIAEKKHSKKFLMMDTRQRTALLIELDAEQKEYQTNKRADAPNHYFRMMKELTLLGYFTSEIGCTQALIYLPVPGRYDGDMTYKKGDKAWAI